MPRRRRDRVECLTVLCPVCQDPLVIVECGGVELDACVRCQGLWFDAQELQQLFALAGVPDQILDLVERLEVLPQAGPRRRCPRCRARMVRVHDPGMVPDVILDRCPADDGLWFDRGELGAFGHGFLGEEDAALARVRRYLGAFFEPRLRAADAASSGAPPHEGDSP
ncbi:MAG: zf-TFIIB domain-containing protein [Planctomycetota bacterium]